MKWAIPLDSKQSPDTVSTRESHNFFSEPTIGRGDLRSTQLPLSSSSHSRVAKYSNLNNKWGSHNSKMHSNFHNNLPEIVSSPLFFTFSCFQPPYAQTVRNCTQIMSFQSPQCLQTSAVCLETSESTKLSLSESLKFKNVVHP